MPEHEVQHEPGRDQQHERRDAVRPNERDEV